MAGRRHTSPVPRLTQIPWEKAGVPLEDFLKHLRDGFSGMPTPHELTHLVTGNDALQTPGAPDAILLGETGSIGLGPSFAREDHQHDTTALQTQIQDMVDEALIFALLWN